MFAKTLTPLCPKPVAKRFVCSLGSEFLGTFALALLFSNPAHAVITINDGATLTISSNITAADDYNTDHQNTATGGILKVTSAGELTFATGRTVSNTFGEGVLELEGELIQDASSPSTVAAKVVSDGGVIRSLHSRLNLTGGGTYTNGSAFEASGGDIYLAGGTHNFGGTSTLGGNSGLYVTDGTMFLAGDVNSPTGAASGSLAVQGGTISGFASIPGASSTISTSLLYITNGTLGDARLRVTGIGATGAGGTFFMDQGYLINDGDFQHVGMIESDTAAISSGHITNNGTWYAHGGSSITNTGGSGRFINKGLLKFTFLLDTATIAAKVFNDTGAEIQASSGGTLALSGGGSYDTGSIFTADGTISLSGGTHEIAASTLSGAGYLQAAGNSTRVEINGSVGSPTGPATGGFQLSGATLSLDPLLVLGGISVGKLNAERGLLERGTIDGVTIRFTGASQKSAGNSILFKKGKLINEGTFTHHSGGIFDLDSVATFGDFGTITNSGIWNFLGSSQINSTFTEGGFLNSGTVVKSGVLGSTEFLAFFKNETAATIQVDALSAIRLNGGSLIAEDSILTVNGTLSLGEGTHSLSDSSLTGSGYLAISGTSPSSKTQITTFGALTGPATGGLHMAGGRLTANELLGVAGKMNVERGLLGSGKITQCDVRLTGASTKLIDSTLIIGGGELINEGTMAQQANGVFQLDSSSWLAGKITNAGIWNIEATSSFLNDETEGQFVNKGILELLPLAGVTTMAAIFRNDIGATLRVQTGADFSISRFSEFEAGSTLDLPGGFATLTAGNHLFKGNTLTGSGAVRLSGGSAYITHRVGSETGPATGGFTMSGGTLKGEFLSFPAPISGPGVGNIAVDHGSLISGTIDDANLRYTGYVDRSTAAVFSIKKGSLTIDGGTMSQSAGSHIQLDADAAVGVFGTVINNGVWNALGSVNFDDAQGEGLFQNKGFFNATLGSVIFHALLENQDGGNLWANGGSISLNGNSVHSPSSILQASSGSQINLNAGTHTFNGGSLTGGGYVYAIAGTTNIAGNVGASSGPATGKFSISGGTITGVGMLSSATGHFGSGVINGDMTLRFTTEFLKAASSNLSIIKGTIRNDGSYVQSTGGSFNFDSNVAAGGGTVVNNGTWTVNATTTYDNSFNEGVFVNNGLFLATAGTTTILPYFQQGTNGVLRATGGSVLLNKGSNLTTNSQYEAVGGDIYFNGGTHTLSGGELTGTSFIYASGGTVAISGDVGAASGTATGNFGIAGATLTGTHQISAHNGYLSTGTITGGVTLRYSGTVNKIANTTLNMDGGTLRNDGIFNAQAGSTINLDSVTGGGAGTILNYGTWNFSGATTYNDSFNGGLFQNYGTVDVLSGNSTIVAEVRHQPGSIFRITGGQILLNGGGSIEPGATLNPLNSEIYLNGGTHTFNGGSITGNGYVFSNAGTTNIAADVNSPTGPATGGFGISGGTVTGSATISADHGWFNIGSMTGSATIRLTGNSTKVASTNLTMNGGTILNEGTWTNQAAADINLDNLTGGGAGTLHNRGTWNLVGASTYNNSFGGGQIINQGLFHSQSGNSTIIAAFHHQSGSTLRVSANQILLNGGGTMVPGATLDAAGGALYLNGGTHTLSGGSITGGNFVYSNAGTTNITGDVNPATGPATGGFGISGGTVTGTGTLSAERGHFSTGLLTGSATIRLTGASNKITATVLNMNGGTIINEGTWTNPLNANINLDNLTGGDAGTIVNKGTWNFTASAIYDDSYNAGQVQNEGLMHSIAGTSRIYGAVHHRNGSTFRCSAGWMTFQGGGTMVPGATLDAVGGDLYFQGGTHTLSGGSITGSRFVYASSNTVNITGDVNSPTGPATGGFGINGGTVTGTGTISADHGQFSTGLLTGSAIIRLTGASNKITATVLNMNGGTIINEGTWTNPLNANINLDDTTSGGAGTILNKGTWNFTASATYDNSFDGGQVQNEGLMHSIAGTSRIYGAVHHRDGSTFRCSAGWMTFQGGGTMVTGATLDADGGDLYFQGGTHTLSGGYITGSRYVYASAGTVSITGNVNSPTGPATGGFGIIGVGAIVSGSATLSADHGYFSTGQISGSPTIRITGNSTKLASTDLNMNGGTILNEGTWTNQLDADINLDNLTGGGAGTLRNTGTWNFTANTIYDNSYNAGQVQNEGLMHSIAGTSRIYGAVHHRSGSTFRCSAGWMTFQGGGTMVTGATLDADGGDLYFQGGTHTLSGGSITGSRFVYASSNTVNITGEVNSPTGPATGGFGINGGTVTGTGTLSADHGYFSTGLLTGSATIRLTGASTKITATVLNMNGGTIINEGTWTNQLNANINLDDTTGGGAGTIVNKGTWIIENTCNFDNSYNGGTIQNSGTWQQNAGTVNLYTPFTNDGNITTAGTTYFHKNITHTGSLGTNGYVQCTGGTHSMSGPAAFLGGSGGIGGTLTLSNGAKISPGNSPGTLTNYGTLQFVAGGSNPAITIEIESTTLFDKIQLTTGSLLALGTNLTDLQLTLGATPTIGGIFRIVNAAATTGTFTGRFRNAPSTGSIVSAPFGGQNHYFQVNYDPAGKYIDLLVLSGYNAWIIAQGLTGPDANFDADPDKDGITNGIEFVLNTQPNPARADANSSSYLPTVTLDATHFRFIYRQHTEADYLLPHCQYGSDLSGWTQAIHGQNGIMISNTPGFYGPTTNRIEVAIPRALEVNGKLFGRLRVEQ